MAKVEGVTVYDKDYDLLETTDLNTTMQKFEDALGANDIDKTNIMEGGIVIHNLKTPNTAFTTGHSNMTTRKNSGTTHIRTNNGTMWQTSNTYTNSNASSFTTIATSGGYTSEQLFNTNTGYSLKQYDVMRVNYTVAVKLYVDHSTVTLASDDLVHFKVQYATTNSTGTLGGWTDFVTAAESVYGAGSAIFSDQDAAKSETTNHWTTVNWSGIKILAADDIIYGTRIVIKCDADAKCDVGGFTTTLTIDRRSGS
jgi:hypothetical protein|tara:strand:+ start:328 stop:1089 length:762 start_codon:yes stop_codon:yes gene_type:complete